MNETPAPILHRYPGLPSLLGLVLVLLIVAIRNTWDLLVTVADKRS